MLSASSDRVAGLSPKLGKSFWTFGKWYESPPALTLSGPYRPSCHGVSWAMLAFCFPEVSAAEETLPGPAKQPQPHKGACSGKNKAPTLGAHLASPGCTWAAPTGREGQPTTAQRGEGTCCPEVTWLGRPGMKQRPSHSQLQIPVHHCEPEVYGLTEPFFSGPCSNR